MVVRDTPSTAPTGRKSSTASPKKPAVAFSKFQKREPIDQIYSQIAVRNQYSLGYTPDRASADDSSYHKIQVSAKQKDPIVQARDGYYGGK